MMPMLAGLPSLKRLPLLIAAAAAAVLTAANVFDHVLGYEPCQLCLYQRLAWWIVLGLGCTAMLLVKSRTTLALLIALTALITVAAGGGVAGYQTGVEYGFWPGPTGCSGERELADSLADSLAKARSVPAPPACGTVAWSLFGISMAGYDLLLSLGLTALSALIAAKARRTTG